MRLETTMTTMRGFARNQKIRQKTVHSEFSIA